MLRNERRARRDLDPRRRLKAERHASEVIVVTTAAGPVDDARRRVSRRKIVIFVAFWGLVAMSLVAALLGWSWFERDHVWVSDPCATCSR